VKTAVRTSCELAIVGWWPPAGPARRDRIGSLLLAGRGPDGRLTLVGQVASGLSDVERRRLYALLVKIPRARPQVAHEKQIRGVHWVDPVYTGEVAFREYIPGRGLRHPSWKGLRDTIGAALDGWNSGMSLRKRRYPALYSTAEQCISPLP
jgi:bifunctional non-homologous end joining protein LigD